MPSADANATTFRWQLLAADAALALYILGLSASIISFGSTAHLSTAHSVLLR